MNGGTTFHFVTGGIPKHWSARAKRPTARTSAWAAAYRRSGSTCARGSSTICTWRYRRSCSDAGEALFEGIDWRALGYRCVERVAGEKAIHLVLAKHV